MPHYADGSEAKVGDQVTGKLYNSGSEPKAGTIISITPGVESCNAMVQFTELVPLEEGVELAHAPKPRLAHAQVPPRESKAEAHGSSGPRVALFTCVDYTETKNLTKVG
jgi:hypothetical protein